MIGKKIEKLRWKQKPSKSNGNVSKATSFESSEKLRAPSFLCLIFGSWNNIFCSMGEISAFGSVFAFYASIIIMFLLNFEMAENVFGKNNFFLGPTSPYLVNGPPHLVWMSLKSPPCQQVDLFLPELNKQTIHMRKQQKKRCEENVVQCIQIPIFSTQFLFLPRSFFT